VTEQPERFGSRWGMMLAMLGMAVGTGNIWRFPRIAAKNGGGEFLIPWVVFLVIWSIPLILLEFGLGRKHRRGPIRTLMEAIGPRWAWMGAFAVVVTSGIMFTYSVVAGWTLRFFVASVTGEIPGASPGAFWDEYSTSWWPALTHGLMIGGAAFVVGRGVRSIEKVGKLLMPSLIVLVLVLTVRALTLPGAGEGLDYLFSVDWSRLSEPTLWLEALTQNAWDTGAGFGLVMCYAAYLREKEDTALNGVILPIANNAISLLAAMMILCTVFSVVPDLVANPEALKGFPELESAIQSGKALTPELVQTTIFQQNNEGLTFIWMPQLFATLPWGTFFMVLFFLALSFAAFTSLVSMVELVTRTFVDAGVERRKAIRIVGVVGFLLGLPSVLFMEVFRNQDWVWGVGLILAGLFFAIAVICSGVRRFREEHLNHADSNIHIGRWWDVIIAVLVPLQALVLLVWWLYDASQGADDWWHPLREVNAGTVLFQFAIVLAALIFANRWLVARNSRP
jgi:NSS family neurotransmitter:Na+ symporter